MDNLKNTLNQYDIAIFDIDNTLFNYSLVSDCAIRVTCSKYGITTDEYAAARQMMVERGLSANTYKKDLYFKIIQENVGLPLSYSRDMALTYYDEFYNNVSLYKTKICSIINDIDAQCIAITNSYFDVQYQVLRELQLIDRFSYIITSEEFEKEKPNRILFDRVLELTETNNKKIIMVGDSECDEEFAINSGIDFYPYNANRILIGIAGKSGVGKTTISNLIKNEFNADIIAGDGYHKYDRFSEKWKTLTHYNPDANNLAQLGMDVRSIFYNKNTYISIYDHSTGLFNTPKMIKPTRRIYVVDGLHTLYPEVTQNYIQYRVYVDSEYTTEQKIERDMKKRNHSRSDVVESIINREDDYEKYIQTQKEYANIIINTYNDNGIKTTSILYKDNNDTRISVTPNVESFNKFIRDFFKDVLCVF